MFRLIYDNAFIPDVRKCHYISRTPFSAASHSGYSETSYTFRVTRYYTDAPDGEIISLFTAVDKTGRTASFYPTAAITLLPGKTAKSSDEVYEDYSAALDFHSRYFSAAPAVFDLRSTPFLRSGYHDAVARELAMIYGLHSLYCRRTDDGFNTDWFVILERNQNYSSYRTAKPEDYLFLL